MSDIEQELARDIIQPFSALVNDAISSFSETVISSGTPKNLYHYTNDQGLYCILQSGVIWLNDAFNLNDPTELAYGVQLTVSWLDQKSGITSSVKDYLDRCIAGYVDYGIGRLANSVFISSFSEHSDDLGQWRAYADNGSGFAIEFDGVELERGFVAQNGGNFQHVANKVHYEDAFYIDQMAVVMDAAIKALEDLEKRKCSHSVTQNTATEITTDLMTCLVSMSSVFKNAQYGSEKEYRFAQVVSNLPNDRMIIKTRMRPYSLIRFVEFDWRTRCNDVLKKIIVGPATETKAERFANDCAREFGSKNIKVVKSMVPYRP